MSKKKRLKKIVKGKLNRVLATGAKSLTTASAQQSALAVMDSIAKAGGDGAGEGSGDGLLLDVIGIANPGNPLTETLNIDEDARTFATDFDPIDFREVQDSDNDNIGDNRDILLTKLSLDAILYDRKDGVAGPGTGALSTSISITDSIEASVTSLVTAHDAGNAGVKAAKKTELEGFITGDSKYSEAGIDSLVAEIALQKSNATELKTQIAAMTPAAAASNIVIADAYAENPYDQAGGSKKAHDDAAATDVATPADSQTTKLAGKADAVASILAT